MGRGSPGYMRRCKVQAVSKWVRVAASRSVGIWSGLYITTTSKATRRGTAAGSDSVLPRPSVWAGVCCVAVWTLALPSLRPSLAPATEETLVTVAWQSKVKFVGHSGVLVPCGERVVESRGSTSVRIYEGVSQDLPGGNPTCASSWKTCTVLNSGSVCVRVCLKGP